MSVRWVSLFLFEVKCVLNICFIKSDCEAFIEQQFLIFSPFSLDLLVSYVIIYIKYV